MCHQLAEHMGHGQPHGKAMLASFVSHMLVSLRELSPPLSPQ